MRGIRTSLGANDSASALAGVIEARTATTRDGYGLAEVYAATAQQAEGANSE
jgi:hypothetical protein